VPAASEEWVPESEAAAQQAEEQEPERVQVLLRELLLQVLQRVQEQELRVLRVQRERVLPRVPELQQVLRVVY